MGLEVRDRVSRDSEAQEQLGMPLVTLHMEITGKIDRCSPKLRAPQLSVIKKSGPKFNNCKEVDSFNHQDGFEERP